MVPKSQMSGLFVCVFFKYLLVCQNKHVLTNIDDTINLLTRLGFIVNFVLIPTQVINYLGNITDSRRMIFYLSDEKKDLIAFENKKKMHECEITSIREVAKITGFLVSQLLNMFNYKGNCDAFMKITKPMKSDLMWWF